ncbi:MAG TPA: oligosaccharide flippase family protein [Bryobacteraceae bacterium]|jgi:O-antigen/teichoic acid export membrane protein|nr:oligosaccharide flippase family protein [Bryobacteraceae bacterium]
MLKKESVLGPALLLMCGRTLAFAATFFIPVILVRIFDPTQFGTYKQLFLVFTSVYLIAQVGMATSLYYFLPQAPQHAGRYAANSLLFLGSTGAVCLGSLTLLGPQIARWLSNPALAGYLGWIGLYTFLMMLSSALEIVMISRKRFTAASATYALSDLARAAAIILSVLIFHDIGWLLKGAVFVALARAVATVTWFHREFRGEFRPDYTLLRQQLGYALPFAAAVVVEILQSSVPQYAVSGMFDPATFAIFAVGCLSIPLVDVTASPTCDVMMVTMQEKLASGWPSAVLEIWHDTTSKLALVFFPLALFAILSAREIIILLFTQKYIASVPIFAAWSALILLSTFQVDGVMRVFARTRFLLVFNIVRLIIMAGLIRWSILTFHLIGPVFVILLANFVFKAAGLIRMRKLLTIGFTEVLPWRSLASILAAAGVAGAVMMTAALRLHLPNAALLLAMGAVYTVVYLALVWAFGLMGASEKLALEEWFRARSGALVRTLSFGRE